MANTFGIQSLVFSGHAKLAQSALVCLQVTSAQRARKELRELVRRHVNFDIPNPDRTHAVQLLFSSVGIRTLTDEEIVIMD